MKKSVFVLALLALTPVLYAHNEESPSMRGFVLDIFKRFNPSILEQAAQNPEYNAILEDFIRSYQQNNPVLQDPNDLIAVARNFDRSIQLRKITDIYHELWLSAKVSGSDISHTRAAFRCDVKGVMQGIWATTVNLRQYQLDGAQAELKALRYGGEHFAEKRAQLKTQIKSLKKEIKSLKKEAGNYILSATDNYVETAEQKFLEQDFLQTRQAAQAYETDAAQTNNLQIKTDNKKPVAK